MLRPLLSEEQQKGGPRLTQETTEEKSVYTHNISLLFPRQFPILQRHANIASVFCLISFLVIAYVRALYEYTPSLQSPLRYAGLRALPRALTYSYTVKCISVKWCVVCEVCDQQVKRPLIRAWGL